ncbi:MAG TPA: DUF2304 domain-containing protein [Ilumatobacteraceae bacterium]|nr:DUF2304 domain-containing protein [Ilumatobacteraceae bacterium]
MSARAYVIAVAASFVGLILIFRQVRRGRLRAKYALIWLSVALLVLPFAVVPGLLDETASLLGIAYGPTLLLVAGLVFFAALSIHFSSELSRVEERTRVLAEEISILKYELDSSATSDRRDGDAGR